MQEPSAPGRVDARNNRERILTATREVLWYRGFNAEVSEIATRAGLGVGTIYRHFTNKEALFLTVVEEMAAITQENLSRIAVTVDDAREAIALTMQVGFRQVEEYGQIVIATVSGTAPPPYDQVVNRRVLGHHFGALVKRGIKQGHFRPDLDVEYAVAAWFALVAPDALSRLTQSRTLHDIAAATTNFYLAGLGAEPTPPTPHRPPPAS